jgi:hypothetical protein
MQFKVGDKVTWDSQAGGGWTSKAGEVVAVVPPFDGDARYTLWEMAPMSLKSPKGLTAGAPVYAMFDGWQRDHECYLVLVPHPGKGKPSLYCPRVSALRPVQEPA